MLSGIDDASDVKVADGVVAVRQGASVMLGRITEFFFILLLVLL